MLKRYLGYYAIQLCDFRIRWMDVVPQHRNSNLPQFLQTSRKMKPFVTNLAPHRTENFFCSAVLILNWLKEPILLFNEYNLFSYLSKIFKSMSLAKK
ncbi:hypothetical protein CS542_04220 [Pedobacter sp. IW39]|nr:hypothetical protein CS542_04220 [Pedobacter sp. IW39]